MDKAYALALPLLPVTDCRHVVTMTGELCDVFLDRNQGVQLLTEKLAEILGNETLFYAGGAGLLTQGRTVDLGKRIASANWRATAEFVAQNESDCLLIDVGSTTTDVVLIAEGQIDALGNSDAERLTAQELTYTGVVRTPVMAVAQKAPLHGSWYPIVAERFATMGDVYRLTGELDDHALQHFVHFDAADGGEAELSACARRLARMLGCDLDDAPLGAWSGVARCIRECQLALLFHAVSRVISRQGQGTPPVFVAAGVGRFLVAALAARFGARYRDIGTFFSGSPPLLELAAVCAPATSLAYLTQRSDG